MDKSREGETEAREENIEAKEIIRKPIFTIMEEYANLKLSQQQAPVLFDLVNHLERQKAFSIKAFGPHDRTNGVIAHIRKELLEVQNKPEDLMEWIDIVLLAFDGAWRNGHSPDEIAKALGAKLAKNEKREWPDWRNSSPDKAIEHERADESPSIPLPTEQEIEAGANDFMKKQYHGYPHYVKLHHKETFLAAISWYQRWGK